MKQVFVANPKGGCGKTALATQIASYYAAQGLSVGLADHDPQRSSLDWLRCRPSRYADITPIATYSGEPILPQKFDLVIHDMPAASSLEYIQQKARCRDKLLIPMLASPTDIKAGIRFMMMLNREGWVGGAGPEIGLVANRVRSNTNYFKVLVSFLEQVNMSLITSIRDTQNYIRAMDSGVSIFELPKSRVAKDLLQWKPLLAWLENTVEVEAPLPA